MFNFSKDQIQETTERVAASSDQAIKEIAQQVKHTANELLGAVQDTTDAAQDKAKSLIQHLKNNVADLQQPEHTQALAQTVTEGATRVTAQVKEEVAHTYQTIKQKTAETVQTHPIGTVLVAAGAGLLLGYLLGHKRQE